MNPLRAFLAVALGALLLFRGVGAAPSPSVVRAEPFPLGQVRLLDGPFREAMLRDQRYLLSLDVDRLLHTFRLNAGLPTSAHPLGGWEEPKCEVRGHSLGHYLSACALMYAAGGDRRFKDRADRLVAGLARCQAASPGRGFHRGYLAAFPEEFFDRVDTGRPVWAPYYTLHKIMAGLLDAHELCANAQALEVLKGMAGWLKFRVDRLTVEQIQKSLNNEHGGMNEVLANLFAVTKDPEHLRLAAAFNHQAVFEPLARGEDRLTGLHANTQIPKITGVARQFELTGQKPYRDIATFFWRRVALDRSYVIGGHSDREHFHPIEETARHLSPATAETCNTYNMLKLTRHLFGWTPEAQFMDFYERALYNHILASQDPRQGMVIYFAPLKPGHFKSYSTPLDSFWCCLGTGMENHARYGEAIYSRDAGSLWVNLFIPSELNWGEKGLTLRQETGFPEEPNSRLTLRLEKPAEWTLRLRWPAWADSMTVTVNGKPVALTGKPGSYPAVTRTWRDGDRVELRLPMRLRTESLPDEPKTVAFLFGPIVLAGQLGREGLDRLSPYVRGQLDLAGAAAPAPPVLVSPSAALLQRVKPIPGKPLEFRTENLARPADVSLIPYYQLHHQRYAVYWKVLTEAEWEKHSAAQAALERRLKELDARTSDQLAPNDPASERAHHVEGLRTGSGEHLGQGWRHANDGGWFSFRLKCPASEPAALLATYWGGEQGPRNFEILVDGQKIASQSLHQDKPGEFFDLEYPIPHKLTEGKPHVTVRFQAQPGNFAGGLFGARMVRQVK